MQKLNRKTIDKSSQEIFQISIGIKGSHQLVMSPTLAKDTKVYCSKLSISDSNFTY